MKSPAALSQAEREQRLEKWAAASGVELSTLDGLQQGVVLAALVFLSLEAISRKRGPAIRVTAVRLKR